MRGNEHAASGRRVLVINDDGFASPGLRTLVDSALEYGLDATVVAPSWDASGAAAALTAVTRDGALSARPRDELWHDVAVYEVEASPAFIVRSALFGAFGPPPDLVLVGVDSGLNLGSRVLHSGTVGAALTAACHHCRSLAISAESPHLEGVGQIACLAIDWVQRTPPGSLLNVNVPATRAPGGLSRGVRVSTLSSGGVVPSTVTDESGRSVAVAFADVADEAIAGSDVEAIAAGFVSVTAIRAPTSDLQVDLDSIIGDGADIEPIRRASARHESTAPHPQGGTER